MSHARRFSVVQPSKMAPLFGVMLGLLLAVPAVAGAAAGWQSGPLVESQDFNCITADVEQEAGTYMSYYTDPTNPPKAGDVYYVAIDVTGIGDTCAGIYADVNLGLPSGTSLAVSASDPVRCFLEFPNTSTFRQDTTDCPQSLGTGTTPGFYSLDPVHANPPFWPLPQGGTVEIQVPVTSAAGVNKFQGYVQLADGDYDPTLAPTVSTIVDPATVTTTGSTNNPVGVYYQTPSISGQIQHTNHAVDVSYTAWVQNNGNDGNVVPQLAVATAVVDPHTNKTTLSCSNPTPLSLSFGSAALQHPNTETERQFHHAHSRRRLLLAARRHRDDRRGGGHLLRQLAVLRNNRDLHPELRIGPLPASTSASAGGGAMLERRLGLRHLELRHGLELQQRRNPRRALAHADHRRERLGLRTRHRKRRSQLPGQLYPNVPDERIPGHHPDRHAQRRLEIHRLERRRLLGHRHVHGDDEHRPVGDRGFRLHLGGGGRQAGVLTVG
jgi:hypothetical protein